MNLEKKFEEVRIEKLRDNHYKICLKDRSGNGFNKDGRKKNIRELYDFITQSEKNLHYKPKIQFEKSEIEKDIESYALKISNKAKEYKKVEAEQLKLEIDAQNPKYIRRP